MKRIISIIITLTLITGVITGCNKDTEKNQTTGSKTTKLTSSKKTTTTASKKTTTKKTTTNDSDEIDNEEPGGENPDADDNEGHFEEEVIDFEGKTLIIGYPSAADFLSTDNFNEQQVEAYKYISEKYNVKYETKSFAGTAWEETFVSGMFSGVFVCDFFVNSILKVIPRLPIKGLVHNLDDIIDYSNDLYNSPGQEYCKWEGKHAGWMAAIDLPDNQFYIAFNRDIFDKEGLTYPLEYERSGNWTWETFLEIAKEATRDTDGDGITDQWGLSDNPQFTQPGINLAFSNGAQIVESTDEGFKSNLSSRNVLMAMQFLSDLINVYKVMPYQNVGANTITPYMQGKAAMGFWNNSAKIALKCPSNSGIVVYPVGSMGVNRRMMVAGQIWMACVPSIIDKNEARKSIKTWLEYNTLKYIPESEFYLSPDETDREAIERLFRTNQIFSEADYYETVKYARTYLASPNHSFFGQLNWELIKGNGIFDTVMKTNTPPATIMEKFEPWLAQQLIEILEN